MKIAEALKRIHTLKGRLRKVWAMAEENSYYMEGRTKPEMDLTELLSEASRLAKELRELKSRTQKRNHEIKVGNETLAEVLLRLADMRSEIVRRTAVLNAMPKGSKDRFWADDSVVIYTPVLTQKEQRSEIEELSKKVENLDVRIQKINWSKEL